MHGFPSRVQAAIEELATACGELGTLRKKWNFLPSTMREIESRNDTLCDAVTEVLEYLEDLRAENDVLRTRLGMEPVTLDAVGGIAELSECTGQCAAELAKLSQEDRPRLREIAEENGLSLDESEIDREANEIITAKKAGHECSACEKGH